jgi:hypothetical protein
MSHLDYAPASAIARPHHSVTRLPDVIGVPTKDGLRWLIVTVARNALDRRSDWAATAYSSSLHRIS